MAELKKNFDPGVPCHRVVLSDGRVGQYNRGVRAKARKLRQEGVPMRNGLVVGIGEKR